MLPGNVCQEVIIAFLTDVFTSICFTRYCFTGPTLGPIVFAADHSLRKIEEIEENNAIFKVHVIL